MKRLWPCILLIGSVWALDGAPPIVLKDGSKVAYLGEVQLENNMLVLNTQKGKLILSKVLIDWPATWRQAPQLVEQFEPETARRVAEEKAKQQAERENRPNAEIVITNKTLKSLKPGQGLVAWHEPEPAVAAVGSRPAAKGPIIDVITHGDRVSLDDHLEPGRYVIFDFYADWCGPCRRMDPQLKALVKKYPGHVALKKVDIVKWRTPVAQQYSINSIPYVRLYDPNGKNIMSGSGYKAISYLKDLARKESW